MGSGLIVGGLDSRPSKLRSFACEAAAWLIREELERHKGNVQATARALGVNRQSLYKLTKRLGVEIQRPERRGHAPGPLLSPMFSRFLGARSQL
jgi:hypothetical protein